MAANWNIRRMRERERARRLSVIFKSAIQPCDPIAGVYANGPLKSRWGFANTFMQTEIKKALIHGQVKDLPVCIIKELE